MSKSGEGQQFSLQSCVLLPVYTLVWLFWPNCKFLRYKAGLRGRGLNLSQGSLRLDFREKFFHRRDDKTLQWAGAQGSDGVTFPGGV